MKQILVVNLHSGRVRPPPYIIPQNQRKSNCIPQRYGASIMVNDCVETTMLLEYGVIE